MTQTQKLIVLIIAFLVMFLGLSELLMLFGGSVNAVRFFKAGFAPHLAAFVLTVFTIIPIGDKWMEEAPKK